MFSDYRKKTIYEPSSEIETPKYSYQDVDTRTYSVECGGSAERPGRGDDEGQILSLKNLSGLVERFLGSNHIRRRLRVCRTKCG
jgi:hypothetical protein